MWVIFPLQQLLHGLHVKASRVISSRSILILNDDCAVQITFNTGEGKERKGTNT